MANASLVGCCSSVEAIVAISPLRLSAGLIDTGSRLAGCALQTKLIARAANRAHTISSAESNWRPTLRRGATIQLAAQSSSVGSNPARRLARLWAAAAIQLGSARLSPPPGWLTCD